jgi:hypothetical protein
MSGIAAGQDLGSALPSDDLNITVDPVVDELPFSQKVATDETGKVGLTHNRTCNHSNRLKTAQIRPGKMNCGPISRKSTRHATDSRDVFPVRLKKSAGAGYLRIDNG